MSCIAQLYNAICPDALRRIELFLHRIPMPCTLAREQPRGLDFLRAIGMLHAIKWRPGSRPLGDSSHVAALRCQ